MAETGFGALFLLFFGSMALSHVLRRLTAREDVVLEKVANMTSKKSQNSNAKANDIYMEINAPGGGMPDIVAIVIPENKPGTAAPVELRVGITNNTSSPFPFRHYGGLIPELVGPDGQVKIPQEPIYRQFGTQEYDWALVRVRDSIGISLTAKLSWRNNSLQLQVPTNPDYWQVPITPDNSWTFDALGTGTYQMRFTYDSPNKEILSSNPKTRQLAELEGIATRRLVTPFVNLRLVQPVEHDKSAVEVDGIRFETLVPDRTLNVPQKELGAKTLVQLAGIRITNNTPNPIRFSFHDTLIPEIVGADGQIQRRSYFSDWLSVAQESDFVMILPGKNINFFLDAALWWQENDQLLLVIDAGNSGAYTFEPILGNYKICLNYVNYTASVKVDYPINRKQKRIENIWTGIVTTPFVEFHVARN